MTALTVVGLVLVGVALIRIRWRAANTDDIIEHWQSAQRRRELIALGVDPEYDRRGDQS